jgi:hypothetical protein
MDLSSDLKQILYMAGAAHKRKEDRKAARQMAAANQR